MVPQTTIIWIALISLLPCSDSTSQCTYSFFFLTYRQPLAAKVVFDRIRGFYPTAPIYILTDVGGVDLAAFCVNDENCRSTFSSVRLNHAYRSPNAPMTNHSLDQLFSYFDHFAEAAKWGACEFVLQVEEDVWHNRKLLVSEKPIADAGGGNNNRPGDRYLPPLQEYLIKLTGKTDLGSNILTYIAGGSYYRSSALIDCVDNKIRHLDWYTMHKLDKRLAAAWDTVPGVLFLLGGYRTAYWEAVCDRPFIYKNVYHKECVNATIVHAKLDNPARKFYRSYNDSVMTYAQAVAAGKS